MKVIRYLMMAVRSSGGTEYSWRSLVGGGGRWACPEASRFIGIETSGCELAFGAAKTWALFVSHWQIRETRARASFLLSLEGFGGAAILCSEGTISGTKYSRDS